MARGLSFLSTREDMDWLRDVHIPDLPRSARSAFLRGNEDAPDRVEVYATANPRLDDEVIVYEADRKGRLRRIQQAARRDPQRRASPYETLIVIQGNYGGRWEDVTAETNWKDARANLKAYRANESVPFRAVTRRVHRETGEAYKRPTRDARRRRRSR